MRLPCFCVLLDSAEALVTKGGQINQAYYAKNC